MSENRIFIFTTTRADYGLLRWVITGFQRSSEFETHVVVGGTHLSEIHGYTVKEILRDGVQNIVQVPFLSTSSNAIALISSVGNGLSKISRVFSGCKPDFLMLLGDRYELFIAAIAALICGIPIIHLHGGEVTEGVIDEQVRHAITKMAHIHMPSTEFYAENISKMGEEDWRIHIVGAPGLENMKRSVLYSKKEILKLSGVDVNRPTILCTYHPATLEDERNVTRQTNNLLKAVSEFDLQIIFTRPNAEVGSDKIVETIKDFVGKNDRAYFFDSLGSRLYLSFLKYVKAVAGNSSSGVIEVPLFHIPTVNIGNRQKGRFKPESIIQTGYLVSEITEGLEKALYDKEFLEQIKHIKNPYGDGNTSKYVVEGIKEIVKIPKERLLKKKLNFEVKRDEWHRYF